MPNPVADPRLTRLHAWLAPLTATWQLRPETLAPASADASFRRYFRVASDAPEQPSLIIMDAPPAHEDCRPFVHVAQLFGAAGVNVPRVLAQDLEQGFLLLGDLGRDTYLDVLDAGNADGLYRDAMSALLRIQLASRPDQLPLYDRALLTRELELFPEWYIKRHKGHVLSADERATIDAAFALLIDNNLAQPTVYVHRDYHSRNLMRMAGQAATPGNPGILDFQDAVQGPITYDLVSLLRDAYVQWDEEQVLDWTIRYWEAARKAGLPVQADFGEFWRDFEWMGLQRHLKVLGIFARLSLRDGKDGYLKDLPLVLHYARKTAERYNGLRPLQRLLDTIENTPQQFGYTF